MAELTKQGATKRQALIFLANFVVTEKLAQEIETEMSISPGLAWDRAGEKLSADPEGSKRAVLAALARLEKRFPDAKNR